MIKDNTEANGAIVGTWAQPVAGSIAGSITGTDRLGAVKATGTSNGATSTSKRSQPVGVKTVEPDLPEYPDEQGDSEKSIRANFVAALTANQKTVGTLTAATQAAIEAGFDRDDCITWGLDAGLSDGYVRSTVSRLFVELVGRVKKAGGGRKRGSDAIRIAKLTLKYTKGNYKKAKALLLAARRALEAMEKQSLKD